MTSLASLLPTDEGPLPERELTKQELALGVVTLRLYQSWQVWIHRIVETVSLKHPSTFSRQVTFDFTLRAGVARSESLPTVVWADEDEPIHYVPLTLFTKRSLVNLTALDDGGNALSLLTRDENSGIAAAMLEALADKQVGARVREEFRDSVPKEICHDCWTIVSADAKSAQEAWLRFAHLRDEPPAAREWRLCLRGDREFMSVANDLARNFLVLIPMQGSQATRRVVRLAYDQHIAPAAVSVPRALRPLQSAWIRVFARPRGVTARERLRDVRAGRPAITRRQWLRVFLGWAPKRVAIDTPAISRTASFHFEFEAPEGLNVTRTTLQTSDAEWWDCQNRSVLRSHVHIARARPGSGGRAVVNIRPRSETIVRAACISSAITTVVLGLTLARWDALVANLGTVPALLLFVPAGLAGYVARSSESPATTEVLFGIRLMAFASAVWAFSAVLVLVAGRSCEYAGAAATCENWNATFVSLAILLALSVVTLIALLATLTCVCNPPEQGAVRRPHATSDEQTLPPDE